MEAQSHVDVCFRVGVRYLSRPARITRYSRVRSRYSRTEEPKQLRIVTATREKHTERASGRGLHRRPERALRVQPPGTPVFGKAADSGSMLIEVNAVGRADVSA